MAGLREKWEIVAKYVVKYKYQDDSENPDDKMKDGKEPLCFSNWI